MESPLTPATIDQAMQVALRHHQAGRTADAQHIYMQVLSSQPNHTDALNLLGILTQRAGQSSAALDLVQKAVRLRPDIAEYRDTLGNILCSLRRPLEAIAQHRQAVLIKPASPRFQNNLGNALRDAGLMDDAVAAFRRAIELDSQYAAAYSNLGVALAEQGLVDNAIASFRGAIRLKPDLAEAHCALGSALRNRGMIDDAIASCLRSIQIRPGLAEAWSNLGNGLKELGHVDEALTAFRRAVELNPSLPYAHSDLLFALHLDAAAQPSSVLAQHRNWAEQHAPIAVHLVDRRINDREPDRRLRIGYVSADFRRHSVASFFEPLLHHHDRASYEVCCYSSVRRPDEVSARIQRSCDAWHDVHATTDADMAELIQSHQIDVLVDLSGHTAGHRLAVFALRPAPIQITYLGYPATTGLAQIDYRITDSLADPPGNSDALNVERLWRLPTCGWCYGADPQAPEISPRLAGPITFGSFASLGKINPWLIELWANVLKRTNDSRLVLKSSGAGAASAQRFLLEQFIRHGIAAERLTLLPMQDYQEHLRSFHQLDIALDTFPYNGTTTTCEALWMGVPVVTLAGAIHASRVGVSLLTNIGLRELIAENPEQYVSIARELATDAAQLADMRSTLRPVMRDSPLMDAGRFTREIETAYRNMWRNWCEALLKPR